MGVEQAEAGLAAVQEYRALYPLVRDDRGRVVGGAGDVELNPVGQRRG
jgi:hypothetical protein